MADYERLATGGTVRIRRLVMDVTDTRLALSLDVTGAGGEAVLGFDGVVQLALKQVWDGFPVGLQIVPVGDAGMEDIDYHVTDPEYGALSFWCASFTVTPA